MIQRVWIVFLLFLVDFHLLMLGILGLQLIMNKVVSLVGFYVIAIVVGLLFSFLRVYFESKSKLFYFIFVIPILIVLSILFKLSIMYMFIIGVFIFWRIIVQAYDDRQDRIVVVLVVTTLVVLFGVLFSSMVNEVIKEQLLLVLLWQIVTMIIASFSLKWHDAQLSKNDQSPMIKQFIVIIASIIITTLTILFSIDLLKVLFFSTLKFIVKMAAILFIPFFNWAENSNFELILSKISFFQEGDNSEASTNENIAQTTPIDLEWIYWLIATIVVLLVLYFIYKKTRDVTTVFTKNVDDGITIERSLLNKGFAVRKKVIKPKEPIRLKVFELETLATKLELGRHPHETIRDWFNRLGFKHPDKVVEIYEHVRYGEKPIPVKMEQQFSEQLIEIKQDFKRLAKLKKKDRKE